MKLLHPLLALFITALVIQHQGQLTLSYERKKGAHKRMSLFCSY